MIKQTEEYLKKTLRTDFQLSKLNNGKVPYILSAQFDLFVGCLYGLEVVFALSKTETTPLGYQRARDLLRSTLEKNIVFVIEQLSAMNTHRMVVKGIDFIVPGKRMFMPSIMIDLGGRIITKAKGTIPPAAQCILLYHLEVSSLDGKDAKEIATLTGYSYLTVTRALKWIADNLFPLKAEGKRQLLFLPGYKETLDRIKPFLRNPVIKTIHTEDSLDGIDGIVAGETALGEMSMLAPNGVCKAVDKTVRMTIDEDANAFNIIEVWMYSPRNLAKNGICDRISLILSLDGNEDERVSMELDKIKEQVQW